MSSKKPTPISASALAFSFSTPKSGSGSGSGPSPKSNDKRKNFKAKLGQQASSPFSIGDKSQSSSTAASRLDQRHAERPNTLSAPLKSELDRSEANNESYSRPGTIPRVASPLRQGTPLRSLACQPADFEAKPKIGITTPPRPRLLETPRRQSSTSTSATATTTISSALKPLGAYNLTTPLPPRFSTTTTTTTTTRNAEAGSSTSTSKNLFLRKINEVTPRHEVSSTEDKDQKANNKARLALNETLLSERTADDLFSSTKRKAAMLVEEDEGIGVSPRGKRIAKWTGKGLPPPSVHLSNLLSSSNASLHLFYTSLQHTLYPSHRDRDRSRHIRARQHGASSVSASDKGMTSPTLVSPSIPTAFQHIQSAAPIRLRINVEQGLRGPTHHCTMFWCEVLKWHNNIEGQVDDGKERTHSKQLLHDALHPTKVLVIFQILPHECPKLGVDPRLLASRMNDGRGGRSLGDGEGRSSKKWQVGIWQSSEIVIPFGMSQTAKKTDKIGIESSVEARHEDESHKDHRGGNESEEVTQSLDMTTAILATRYLIAEQPPV
ncbi:hypothetical protein IAT40_001789 [Kwoniella sp. CBS 6097]